LIPLEKAKGLLGEELSDEQVQEFVNSVYQVINKILDNKVFRKGRSVQEKPKEKPNEKAESKAKL